MSFNNVDTDQIVVQRSTFGKSIILISSILLALIFLIQFLYKSGSIAFGFENWRPILYMYLIWSTTLCYGVLLIKGEKGQRALFVLPAFLFTIAMVIFPLIFSVYISLHDWNLSAFEGQKFSGLDNFKALLGDAYYWNSMLNMIYYLLAILVEYAIAFGLALLLNAQIVARKFFRVVFLLPLMLSPVAVSWMIGKSLMEYRFGPAAALARQLGWETPAFFSTTEIARISMMILDAWTFIPFMMIMLLAGLQALSKEVNEAAKIDGATGWQHFWKITFPLMLPVSITTTVIRIIFKLKLADIVINVTSGGPGGATDTVTSFIFREYRDRSNVGYGTMMAVVYLIIIVILMTFLLKLLNSWMQKVT